MAILAAVTAARADTVRLSLDDARGAASRLLAANRPQEALTLADGILLARPKDAPALILKSRALRDMGQGKPALHAARAARQAAGMGQDRFFAALVTAQAQAGLGRMGLAQFWLRRAAQLAPDDQLKALAVRDFRQVRRVTPWRVSLDFYGEHSDNLNEAPREALFQGTGFAPVTLEGFRSGVTGRFSYTIPTSATRRVHLDATAGASAVRPTGSGWAAAGKSASDYAEQRLGFGLRHETLAAQGDRLVSAGLAVDRFWRGGSVLADTGRAEVTAQQGLAPGWAINATLAGSATRRFDVLNGGTRTGSISFGVVRNSPDWRAAFSVSLADTVGDAASLENRETRLRFSLARTRPVAGLVPSMSLEYGSVDYATAPSLGGTAARADTRWTLSGDVLFSSLDFFGFAPSVGVSFSDRQSNYLLYNTRSTDLRIGLKSVF